MGNLEKLLTFALGERVIVTIGGQAQVAVNGIAPCDDLGDVLGGCGDTFSTLTANLVLGTIAGAPDLINVLVLTVLVNGYVILAVVKLLRGVPDA